MRLVSPWARFALLTASSFVPLLASCTSDVFGGATPGEGGAGGSGGAGGVFGMDVSSSTSTTSASASVASSSVTSTSSGPQSTSFTVQAVDQHDAPMPNVVVVIQDEHGVPVDSTYTPLDGHVTVDVPPEGSVSVFFSPPNPADTRDWTTIFHPPAGGLFLARGTVTDPPPAFAPTTYKVVAQGAPANSTYRFWSSCDAYGATVKTSAVLTNTACTELPAASFIVAAYDATDTLVAWGTAGAPTSPGTLIDLAVTLSQSAFEELAVQSADLPLGTLGVHATLSSPVQPSDAATRGGSIVPPAFDASLRVAKLPVERRLTVTALLDPTSYLIYEEPFQAIPGALWLTASDTARPTGLTLALDNLTRPELTWSLVGGAQGQSTEVVLTWTTGGVPFRWTGLLPFDDGTGVTLPIVDLSQAAFRPGAASTFLSASVTVRDRLGGSYEDDLAGTPLTPGHHELRGAHYLDLSP